MRAAVLLLAALIAVSGCTGPTSGTAGYSDTKPKYVPPEPGIHISGHANVGVVTTF